MILNKISDIKKIRKRLGITQKELADKSGVSQSLIAKIESGKAEPTYSKALKLLQVLESSNETRAEEVMTRKVIKCSPNEDIKQVIKIMQEKKISQIPVFEDGSCIGLVSEKSVLKSKLKKGKDIKLVKECMEDSPPIVNKSTSLKLISQILEYNQIVLVSDRGKIIGVITKSDILKVLY